MSNFTTAAVGVPKTRVTARKPCKKLAQMPESSSIVGHMVAAGPHFKAPGGPEWCGNTSLRSACASSGKIRE
jgi:hypothetical protein